MWGFSLLLSCRSPVFFHGERLEGRLSGLRVTVQHMEFLRNDSADRSPGGPIRLLEVERDKERVCAGCACRDAGTAVHAPNPEELPDVHTLLQMAVMPR